MAQIGWLIGKEQLTYDEALQRARAGEIPYPPAFLRALQSDRADQVPSPSTLAGCLRSFELKRITPYYVEPKRLVAPALFGNGAHHLLEQASNNLYTSYSAHRGSGHAEHNMAATIDLPGLPEPYCTLTLRGTSDNVEPPEVLDWKTTGYLRKDFEAYPGHKAQANVYAWLYSKQPDAKPLTHYRIFYISRNDGSSFDARGELKPLDHTENWIRERLYAWAEPVSRGQLPAVHPDYFKENAKTGGPFGCCSYCDVRAACEAAD